MEYILLFEMNSCKHFKLSWHINKISVSTAGERANSAKQGGRSKIRRNRFSDRNRSASRKDADQRSQQTLPRPQVHRRRERCWRKPMRPHQRPNVDNRPHRWHDEFRAQFSALLHIYRAVHWSETRDRYSLQSDARATFHRNTGKGRVFEWKANSCVWTDRIVESLAVFWKRKQQGAGKDEGFDWELSGAFANSARVSMAHVCGMRFLLQ